MSAYVDTPQCFIDPDIVIIAPAYGETKENNISFPRTLPPTATVRCAGLVRHVG